jgi:hypothetical protein
MRIYDADDMGQFFASNGRKKDGVRVLVGEREFKDRAWFGERIYPKLSLTPYPKTR